MVSNSEPLPEGTVIMADNQYAGRGQQENTWHAEPGLNLTASIFLKPSFLPVDKQFMLNMAVSIGIRDALRQFVTDDISIKWPNDIYYKDRKLGGILIENSIIGSSYKSAIIGVGLNVNQTNFNPEQVKTAVSIREILQEDVNLMVFLAEICKRIEVQYLRLKANPSDMTADYLNGLYKFQQNATFRDRFGIFQGIIKDVSSRGQLIISKGGLNVGYSFKEVEFLTNPSNWVNEKL